MSGMREVEAVDRQRWQRPSVTALPVLAELGRVQGLEPLAWQVGTCGGVLATVVRGDRRAVFAHWTAVLTEHYGDAVHVRPERRDDDGTVRLRANVTLLSEDAASAVKVALAADILLPLDDGWPARWCA